MTIGLEHYLALSAVLFGIGLFGALSRRSALVILMCIEIMLNAANLALVGFARYTTAEALTGQAFAAFGIIVAAAEVTVGLAVIIALFRHYEHISVDKTNLLKW
ncbi:MAG: NADH-quinone oxidoreductase subunit NuoK [Dehalococcoidia bacterium]|nr:NADH-quinone oxidoreductase subunit NuoK [Dehalococcoidia bacterium]